MNKVIFAEYGGPEVLELVEAEEPHAGPGTIRIAVRATGVNAHDWRSREGQFRTTHPDALPTGVGLDASGVVDEVGEGVTGVAIGDEVFGEGHETYAEYAVLTAWVPKPANLSFEETAGYASVVESSLRVMREVGIQQGETLLVNGASGGVGSIVLQVARERGITVIAVGGPDNQDYLRSLGAHPTTYGDRLVERVRAIGKVDAAIDVAGSGVVRELVDLTGDAGRVVSIADLTAPEHGVRFSGTASSVQAALEEVVELIVTGRLRTPVDKTYALSESAQAQADSQAGHTRGRRVIVI